MSKNVAFLIFLTRIQYGCSIFRLCTPNTQFQWNGQICFCDSYGRWTEANCRLVQRQEPCKPGEMILNDCSQCICGENGQLVCTNIPCNEQAMKQNPTFQFNYFAATGPRCTPFRSYFINCTLCTCPASGKTSDATCVIDNSCVIKNPTSIFVQTSLKNVCIPKVMYLFPCLHCLCSDEGYFVSNTCVETCTKHHEVESRRCTPKTFYRKECNICWCPMNGIQIEMSCSKSTCKQNIIFQSLSFLENRVAKCKSQTFTKSTCFYCNCNTEGNVNLNSCFENECLKIANFAYGLAKLNCGPGELLPFCSECFCPQNGLTNKKYCTSTCSTPSKLTLIENVLLDSQSKNDLLNLNVIKRITSGDLCTPDTLYIDNERYCYCPDNGRTNFKICTSIKELVKLQDGNTIGMNIDFNSTCEAGTFVDFDCNTCYCMKNGKFDPKWCTNDDCNTKKIILKTNRAPDDVQKAEQTCVPGTISEDDCNYCICPDSGLLKERVCTKNDCTEIPNPIRYDKIICEPLTYYTVDCNICYCPRDGLKNIDRCTKNQCENNFLRSYSCTPGDLFSDYCNVCVCPPNGNKLDKLCTNHTCPETDIPSQKVFKLSQDLLENKVAGETARNLDLCFPGEEFVVGCKVCVCPDMGLKEYASCTPMLCNEANIMPETTTEYKTSATTATTGEGSTFISRREGKSCITYNLTDSSERKECTPGSMYIIRCRQCICPYMGNINHFCRPLPKGFYCEQAYPNFNYLPMGRRIDQDIASVTTHPRPSTSLGKSQHQPIQVTINHNHTKYNCEKLGKMEDACFICDCEKGVVIEEHCYKNDDLKCVNAVPNFLRSDNKFGS